jgi:hypothetical protein
MPCRQTSLTQTIGWVGDDRLQDLLQTLDFQKTATYCKLLYIFVIYSTFGEFVVIVFFSFSPQMNKFLCTVCCEEARCSPSDTSFAVRGLKADATVRQTILRNSTRYTIHDSVFRSDFFKGVVIYNIFTFVCTMFFTYSKTVQHVTYCEFGVCLLFVRPRYGFLGVFL